MLGRLGWLGVTMLVASCGGESQVRERRGPAQAGGNGNESALSGRAGAAGCSTCGAGRAGSAGDLGRGGAALASDGGAPEAGAPETAGGADGGRGGTSGGTSAAGEAGSDGEPASAGASEGGAGGETAGMRDGLGLSKVAVYQAVEVTLMRDGVEPGLNAPIVAEREALVRVWLAPDPAWTARSVEAELAVGNGANSRTATSVREVSAASVDADLASTFTFTLRASEVSDTTTLSVTLRDAADQSVLARWPSADAYALVTASSNGPFVVTLVPVVANGFTPDLGAQTVGRFERYLSHVYPASSVEMTVRATPLKLDFALTADGGGWDDALDALYAARDADQPAPNTYYYGVLTPGSKLNAYCGDSCVVGLSVVAARNEEGNRGALGTGFFESNTDTFSQETMAHEMGHALGREHAPCGHPDSVDPKYPYSSGQIGVFGYDGRALLDRDDYKDEMTYCVPVWISDYTWSGIFSRISYVNGLVQKRVATDSAARARFRTLSLGTHGLHWGSERTPASPPEGEPAELELLDAAGAVLEVLTVPFARFDHVSGGFFSVPADVLARSDVKGVRVGGAVLALP